MSLPVVQKKGDIILGGLFSLHDMVMEPSLSFTSEPPPAHCTRFNFRTFRWMQTMIFAIEEINRDGKLLPNITLGYKIFDSCSTPHQALKAVMELVGNEKVSGVEVETESQGTCRGTVPAVIGDGGSTQSLVVARFLGVFQVPQVSYFSSCACLSDKKEFPAFLRTMPSDLFQVDAMVQLVKHFGWTWVGVIAGDDAYGLGGANIFADEVRKLGACVALHEVIPKNRAQITISSIISKIRSSGARVILVFAVEQDAAALFDEALREGLTGIQWLANNIQPWQLLRYIKQVEYISSFGHEIKFDENGDPAAMYDLVNWQMGQDGGIEFVTIGKFDETTTVGKQKLQIEEPIIVWNGNETNIPLSVCSSICPAGTRKSIRPNFPVCCHDCVVCTAGEISNHTDAIECVRCLPEFWSNDERTASKGNHYHLYADPGNHLYSVAGCCSPYSTKNDTT
ncbi:hypothetical protein CgunFtcFv8_010703 [Champsocephalus gunnari]|uniref:Uncharacterized protein n=1 Tax=Champsocephalus gunnari TaxID=52237 RepID=A0AAN8DUT1_CHAGU|nr:hypothetical protein CgunFtcFv8_010703 [Champsocephalus gunnari]